jgi:Protein of unknown function (DUF3592)
MSPQLFFAIISLCLCGFGFWLWRKVVVMGRWKETAAIVGQAEERERTTANRGIQGSYYIPNVVYRYEVEGRKYTSSRLSLVNFTIGSKGELDGLLNGVRAGGSVTVYYDPNEPGQAVLRRPGYDGVIVVLFLGIGSLGLIGVSLLAQ